MWGSSSQTSRGTHRALPRRTGASNRTCCIGGTADMGSTAAGGSVAPPSPPPAPLPAAAAGAAGVAASGSGAGAGGADAKGDGSIAPGPAAASAGGKLRRHASASAATSAAASAAAASRAFCSATSFASADSDLWAGEKVTNWKSREGAITSTAPVLPALTGRPASQTASRQAEGAASASGTRAGCRLFTQHYTAWQSPLRPGGCPHNDASGHPGRQACPAGTAHAPELR